MRRPCRIGARCRAKAYLRLHVLRLRGLSASELSLVLLLGHCPRRLILLVGIRQRLREPRSHTQSLFVQHAVVCVPTVVFWLLEDDKGFCRRPVHVRGHRLARCRWGHRGLLRGRTCCFARGYSRWKCVKLRRRSVGPRCSALGLVAFLFAHRGGGILLLPCSLTRHLPLDKSRQRVPMVRRYGVRGIQVHLFPVGASRDEARQGALKACQEEVLQVVDICRHLDSMRSCE